MLEKIANFATIVLVVVACAFTFTHWKKQGPPPPRTSGDYGAYAVGESVKTPIAPGIVFAVSSKCKHCVNDLPKMKQLVDAAHAKGVKVSIVTQDDIKTQEEWLAQAGITADHIEPATTSGLEKIPGTPTTIVIGQDYKVRFSFVGELTPKAVAEAAALLQ